MLQCMSGSSALPHGVQDMAVLEVLTPGCIPLTKHYVYPGNTLNRTKVVMCFIIRGRQGRFRCVRKISKSDY